MILITTTNATRPADFLMVAQNPVTYELLGFSSTGTPFAYDTDHSLFEGNGRYKPRSSVLPATETELRKEFFSMHYEKEILKLKNQRNIDKKAPLTVTLNTVDYEFDLDELAQNNIKSTIEDFEVARLEAVSLGLPDDGKIPWVLADNTMLPVTQANLIVVRSEGVRRGLRLHMEYNAQRDYLNSLVPGGYVAPTPQEPI